MTFHLDDCKGDWAIVTGASSGIGRVYASELGRRGLNLVLVARRKPELQSLASELAMQSGIRALALALDLTSPDADARVLDAVASIPSARLRLLVSNAGSGQWGAHDPARHKDYAATIALNVAATVALSTRLLPALRAAAPAALVHVSSQAAYQPVPYMAAYAASKAFVHNFSLALHEELREQGVLVQTLVPGPTATEFDSKAGAYASAVVTRGSCESVVLASLEALERGDPLATNAVGLWKQRLFAGLAPPRMVLREVAKMFKPPGN